MTCRAFAIAIGVALWLGICASAYARPRVVIIPFDGDKSGELQELVGELLDEDFSVVGQSKVGRAMDKLGLDSDLTGKQLKKLAGELDADAIVRGELSKKGSHKVLHVLLFTNGKKVRGFRVEFGSAKSDKFKAALKDKLIEKLGGGDGGDDGDAEDKPKKKPPVEDVEDKPKKKPPVEDSDDSSTGDDAKTDDKTDEDDGDDNKNKTKKKVASGDDDEEEPIEGGEGGPAVVATTPHTINRAAVRVSFGPSVSRRNLAFSSRPFEEAPNTYKNDPVPGARVEGDIYPLAFGNPNGILSGLGIGGDFDQTLSLNLTSTVQPGTKFPVKQSHWSVGARLRFVFGKKATSPSVVLKGGYATRTFKVDRAKLETNNLIDLPDVGYKGFTAGADIRFPVAGPVALFAGGGLILVTTTGDIQTSAQYGQAKVTGGEGNLGIDVAIGKRMGIKVMGEFTQMGFVFTGTGQMAINRDGDPMSKDVGGAADRYIGGSLLFGVLY